MVDTDITTIKKKIAKQHKGDKKQLEVIFSDKSRLIVEAPAGYGKTTTMISRIAYLFVTGRVPNPKRILGLTFSVNAALKVKREVSQSLPILLGTQSNPIHLGEKVTITNYHGLCKCILKKYGYLISDVLKKDVNLFKAIGDSDIPKIYQLKTILTESEKMTVYNIEHSIKQTYLPNREDIWAYNRIIISKLLPLEFITHNAVILFVLEIFECFPEVKKFYRNYFSLIVVDEFQDTNCIAWELLKLLISDKTNLIFLGDSLQRIYGFIGALPTIMEIAAKQYNMSKIALSKNYRFRNNPEMLKLDANIRLNAATCFSPTIHEVAKLPAFWGNTQRMEADQIAKKVKDIIRDKNNKIAILFRMRNLDTEIIEKQLTQNSIPYFYGMFTDEDPNYVEFHNRCQNLFIKKFVKLKNINQNSLHAFSSTIKKEYASKKGETYISLLKLLDALIEKISVDYSDLPKEDKYELLIDIFENKQLKQSMEYVDSQVILSTIHGAKGLEWDYIILADVEQWVLTLVCRQCPSRNSTEEQFICRLPQIVPENMKDPILNDLCVFYVGLTRAKKQAYISASAERFNTRGRRFFSGKICCLPMIEGIELINANQKNLRV